MIGRFAPSPTGPLHFGSLVAAVASYCDSKSQGGQWLVRIEDVDETRSVAGAQEDILRTLHRYGMVWDGEVIVQSQRKDLYAQALQHLRAQNLTYPCTCSRKEIADSSTRLGIEGAIYPGTCKQQALKPGIIPAWRMCTSATELSFEDAIQGRIRHNMAHDIGDFVLQRADGLYTYQLAVVVDDALQGVTHVVRGDDLLNSTTRQIWLQKKLGYPTPRYAHIPVVTNANGQKLSKQNLAAAISMDNVLPTLMAAYQVLNQSMPPPSVTTIPAFWRWGLESWKSFF